MIEDILRAMGMTTVLLASSAALAQEDDVLTLGGIVVGRNADTLEWRLGGGGYDTGPFTPDTFTGGVINGEVLLPSPDVLAVIGSPRPYLGADIAISDDPIHVAYAGLNWEAYLTKAFYVGFSLGGSLNSDERVSNDAGEERNLGSPVLFHLQASAGYDFNRSVGIQAFVNHFSNAQLAKDNDGLESTSTLR